jgi:hypothetical protein
MLAKAREIPFRDEVSRANINDEGWGRFGVND